MVEDVEIDGVEMFLGWEATVLDEDDRRLDDDYPLQPTLSKQAAQGALQGSECGVEWVYHQLGDKDGNSRLIGFLSISKNIFYQDRPVVVYTMIDVKAWDEHHPRISETPNHQGFGYTYHDLAQTRSLDDHHRSYSCEYILVAEVLGQRVMDWNMMDDAVRDGDRSLHVVILNIHPFRHHDLYPYRILSPSVFLLLVLRLSHRHRRRDQHKAVE